MENKIRVIRKEPFKAPYLTEIENTAEGIQEAIGGGFFEALDAVEFMGVQRKLVLCCDDEGKLKGLDPNLVIESWLRPDIVRGPIVIVTANEDEFVSMTDDEASAGMAYLNMTTIKEVQITA